MFNLKIIDVINSEFAVSPEDGDIIFDLIKEKIDKEEKIIIDFSNIDIMTTAFLNNAVGKLYNIYDKEKLNKYISMKNISKSDLNLVKKVIERAKIKFSKEDISILEGELEDEF
ncbi:STAS-like domain-containing protein [Clostridium sp.]|uniref:STAS-like domain-containing protein n=1 Tax=Clostridium sp. TaxID=1506 RepID=UPI00280B9550|nr:STAS-like domain-containing protein [Clostridium sp.]MDY4251678.1 STAS-like domain-containing protein [Clostridium sp.]